MPSPNRSLLLIDDEPDIREVAKISLELVGGYEVRTAGSGVEGLAAAAADPPDAILLDVMMPDMDGPEVVRRLRAGPATAGIPVLFITAKAQLTDRQRLAAADVAGILTKPFDPMTLARDVSAILGWPA